MKRILFLLPLFLLLLAGTSEAKYSQFNNDVNMAKDLTVEGSITVSGNVKLIGDLSCDGDVTVDGDFFVAGLPYTSWGVKAWVHFEGTDAATIKDSFNVSSVSRTGAGIYPVVWDVDFANIYYAVSATAGNDKLYAHTKDAYEVGEVLIEIRNESGVGVDSPRVSVIAIGEQ